MKKYSYFEQRFFVQSIILIISISLLYGCSEDVIKVPPSPQMIVFGEIAPVKIFLIIEPQTIRFRVKCNQGFRPLRKSILF